MTYEIQNDTLLFEIDRTEIVDISVGDLLQPKGFPKSVYAWSEQDSQFVEANPDARLFLKIQKIADDHYKGVGIVMMPEE